MTLLELASKLPSLPPILYTSCQGSKAPWGLSVQSRVTCIFTGISISPGPSLRQCPSRYTFRAGRNLPDKEFRYLRTVIVTAAVYWGFNSELHAGVSTYTSDFSLAGTCVCGKQSLGLLFCRRLQLIPRGASPAPAILLPKLRMHFAEFLKEGSPAHLRILSPPTCVGFGTGAFHLVRSFSRQCSTLEFVHPEGFPIYRFSAFSVGICLHTSLPPSTHISNRALKLLAASLHPQTVPCGTGIFACCPSPMLAASA